MPRTAEASKRRKLSTREKGDRFEREIKTLLEREIADGNFWVQPNLCKIFSKKGYYSHDRRKDIVFDISIEVFMPGAKDFSLLILIECKDYGHAVPVDDLEEFRDKVRQVSGFNVKGIFASRGFLQSGAIEYAKSNGIAFLRYFKRSDFKWELQRSTSSLVTFSYAAKQEITAIWGIQHEDGVSNLFDCYGYYQERYTISLRRLFGLIVASGDDPESELQLSPLLDPSLEEPRYSVDFISQEKLEHVANKALSEIGYSSGAVSLEKVCAWQRSINNLSVERLASEGGASGVLGRITFFPAKITIYTGG
ncbi:MAG: restriction endonuclease [Paludibacter sp.]